MQNVFKDEEDRAFKALAEAQQKIEELKRKKENEESQAKLNLISERNDLLTVAKTFRDESIEAAKIGDFTKASNLKEFAEDAEKQAREIVIEGEVIAEPDESHPKFGEGMGLGKILLILSAIIGGLFQIADYVNYRVQLSEKSISLSLGAEWIHAINTTMFWALCWFFAFGMMYVCFRSISKFINPKEHPEFDLTTKLFNECTPSFQILVSLLLLLSMLFSWVLIFLHNPVSNAG